jgi:hypothetical protein
MDDTQIITRSWLFGLIQHRRYMDTVALDFAGLSIYARFGSRFALFQILMPWELQ